MVRSLAVFIKLTDLMLVMVEVNEHDYPGFTICEIFPVEIVLMRKLPDLRLPEGEFNRLCFRVVTLPDEEKIIR